MQRREFITLLGGTVAALPIVVQALRLPVIGSGRGRAVRTGPVGKRRFLKPTSRTWVDRGSATSRLSTAGRRDVPSDHAEIAAEFVRLQVDIIVAYGAAALVAAKQTTSVIPPIVFGMAGDPVGDGLIASLARPGGNVTGLSILETGSGSKRVELLHEVVPSLGRLAIIANVDSAGSVLEMNEVEATARRRGQQAFTFQIHRSEDIGVAFEAIKNRVDALSVVTDPLVFSNRMKINSLALDARRAHVVRRSAAAGCLISYGPSFPALWRRAADQVDRLRGTKPGKIPVEQPREI
jgi:putative ABC transport system substrate-binding protein